jgi:hypothetical protein
MVTPSPLPDVKIKYQVVTPANGYWLTVGELKKLIADFMPSYEEMMVCISGYGPVSKAEAEPGASEPFMLLTGAEKSPDAAPHDGG